MKSLILCEGKTDSILLSYYLSKVYGWKSIDKKSYKTEKKRLMPKLTKMKIEFPAEQEFSWYFKNNDDVLCIYAVGPNNLLIPSLDNSLSICFNTSEEPFDNIVLLTDRDDDTVEPNIIEAAKKTFENYKIIFNEILHNKWNVSNPHTEDEQRISFLPLVIPFDENGTMETFLLECRKGIDDFEGFLVESGNHFVEKINENLTLHKRYLNSRGLKPKAKLGVYFAITSPNRTYDEGNRILESIPWENYDYFKSTFELLKDI